MRRSTLERNLTSVHTVTRDSVGQETWNHMRGFTLERNLTSVHTVTRDSVIHHIWKDMRGFTLERNLITALHVGSVSIIHLLYTDIQKTFTVSSRGANLSPLGEIRHFHLEIGHSRESVKNKIKKIIGGWGGCSRRICESSVSRHL